MAVSWTIMRFALMRMIRTQKYRSYFDELTGKYMRTGELKDGRDTGYDVFMGEFPELLDIGIMGHCIHGKSGLCEKSGVECYQNGRSADAENMSTEDFARIVEECGGRTYQIALGGCGDPDQHEHFEQILKLCRDNGLVPNFTTSGLGLTAEKARLCKKYCGAVAVSWYRSSYTLRAVECLLAAGVKTNIHYVLNSNTVAEALERLRASAEGEEAGFPKEINAVVFLLHKPVGQGTREKMITTENAVFGKLIKFLDTEGCRKLPFKIGFDSCSVPALLHSKNIDPMSIDTCEGGRWSAYISADMQMMPCSFAHESRKWIVSLRNNSIKEAWESAAFEDFRNSLRTKCPGCEKKELCMGGCPILPEIVLCSKMNKMTGS